MRNLLLQLIYNLLGFLALLAIIFCLYSLARFLYFRQPPRQPMSSEPAVSEKFTKKLRSEVGAGHFHVSDEPITTDSATAPMCLRCHGNFCHNKSEEFRSYYNMHTFFLACEICHIRKEQDSVVRFKWFDDKTGKELQAIQGQDENYGAKIVPVRPAVLGFERLDKFPKEKLALDFMKNKDSYSPAEKEKIKKQLMEHVSEKPVTCEECHCKQGYLNYSELGYDAVRAADLSRIEIVKMIKEYKDFKFPVIFGSEKNNSDAARSAE
jgi:hypothetical protein